MQPLARRRGGGRARRVVEVTSDGVAVLTAPEALRAGDEIAFPYDAGGGNAELLLDYGFGIGADGAAATAPPEDPEAVAAVDSVHGASITPSESHLLQLFLRFIRLAVG